MVIIMKDFEAKIKPFFWSEYNGNYSFCINAGGYKDEIFDARAEEGFEGNGYDWGSLAQVFLDEKMPELSSVVRFGPEAGMLAAYSTDKEALMKFGQAFKDACEDDALIADLFSRAEID